MSYTVKNLREVADAAAGAGFGDVQEARFATGDLDAQDTGVSLHTVKPGKRSAFGHRHENAEEVYVVVAGSGRIKLDDDIVDLGPLDAVRIRFGSRTVARDTRGPRFREIVSRRVLRATRSRRLTASLTMRAGSPRGLRRTLPRCGLRV